MRICSNCGTQPEGDSKFCRNCGTRLEWTQEEANTWRLAPDTTRDPSPPYPTMPSRPANTAEPPQPTGPAYVPPAYASPAYYVPEPPVSRPAPGIGLGDWLNQGWRIYKEYWVEMSMGSLIGAFLSACTLGLLFGPTLLGLYRMAFKAMRGERPDVGDIFEWEGRFLPAVVTFFVYLVLFLALGGAAKGVGGVLSFAVGSFLTTGLALTMPLLLERRMDAGAAISEVARLIFSRNALMWWLVGLVFSIINLGGFVACFFGLFITFPWTVCAAAMAYRDVFGIDDPNRTLP